MNPLTAAIAGAAKPTLITAENFFPQSGGVHRLIQAKESRAGRDSVRVGIRGIGFRDPGPGDLIGTLQCAPAVPTDDYRAVHRRSIGESSRRANPHPTDEEGRNNDHGNCPNHKFRAFLHSSLDGAGWPSLCHREIERGAA